jgi:hypothetical protein
MCFYTSTSFLGKKPRNKNFFLSVSCTEIFVWVCKHIATLHIKWDRFSTKKRGNDGNRIWKTNINFEFRGRRESQGYLRLDQAKLSFTLDPDTGMPDGFRYRNILIYKGGFFFYVLYSTVLHLPHLRFPSVRGCWDRTQYCCDFGNDSQTL